MKYKIAAALIAFSAFSVQAANVAFFNNPAFVDAAQEGLNLRTTLVSGGHTVSDITGSALADFNTGLSGKTILVIPELQNGDLAAALDAPTRAAIANFVNAGGTVQVHGGTTPNDVNFLNGVFGYSITTNGYASAPSTKTAAAAGTPFASGPASLTSNSATTQVAAAALPAGAKSIYSPDGGTNSVMFTVANGTGQVIFMGWDWFGAPPQGAADGGWLTLASLVSTASATPGGVTPASTASIPTLSEWGLIFMSSILAMVGISRMRRRQR